MYKEPVKNFNKIRGLLENSTSMDSRVDRTIQLKVHVLMIMKKDV